MANLIFYPLYAALIIILVFFPEIMPRCAHCKKIKFRPLFRLHKCVSLSLTYKGNISICKKCFYIENITSFDKLKHIEESKKRASYKTRFMVR